MYLFLVDGTLNDVVAKARGEGKKEVQVTLAILGSKSYGEAIQEIKKEYPTLFSRIDGSILTRA